MSELTNSLNIVRQQKQLLQAKSDQIRDLRQTEKEIYRFLGRLEKALEDYTFVHEDNDLKNDINKLEQKIKELKIKVDSKVLSANLKLQLEVVSKKIARYSKFLDVENPNDPVSLDIKNLTIKKKSGDREDFLWEIGSGANWMGYHIATLLALHEHFADLEWSPVPQFLVIDQPSQVYFPDKLQKQSKMDYKPEDVLKVEKIFTALSSHISLKIDNPTQIIIIEHADEITWETHKNKIHLVHRWREDDNSGDNALIPKEWFE